MKMFRIVRVWRGERRAVALATSRQKAEEQIADWLYDNPNTEMTFEMEVVSEQ